MFEMSNREIIVISDDDDEGPAFIPAAKPTVVTGAQPKNGNGSLQRLAAIPPAKPSVSRGAEPQNGVGSPQRLAVQQQPDALDQQTAPLRTNGDADHTALVSDAEDAPFTEAQFMAKLLEIFPDISRDHVSRLFKDGLAQGMPAEFWCDQTIMQILDAGQYPTEREQRLKRKRAQSNSTHDFLSTERPNPGDTEYRQYA